jgi:hypothetical protein
VLGKHGTVAMLDCCVCVVECSDGEGQFSFRPAFVEQNAQRGLDCTRPYAERTDVR